MGAALVRAARVAADRLRLLPPVPMPSLVEVAVVELLLVAPAAKWVVGVPPPLCGEREGESASEAD